MTATTIVIAILSSGALSALVNGIFSLISKKREDADSIKKALRQILYNDIKRTGKQYIAAGQIGSDALEDLIATHQIYHDDLKGNGYLDNIMTAVSNLPIV